MSDELTQYYAQRVEDDPNVIGTYTDADGNTVVLVEDDAPEAIEMYTARADGVVFVKTPRFKFLQIPTERIRPAPGGASCGSYRITAGTLSFIVRDKAGGAWSVLSNNHVLANVDDCSVGDDILQPGAADGGTRPADTIADLTRWVPVMGGGLKKVDCALAHVKSQDDVDLNILGIGYVYGWNDPYTDQKIWKSGRTTGVTRGRVDGVNATVQVYYTDTDYVTFTDCIVSGIPSGPGDSGSAILDFASNQFIGLLFAGNGIATIACKARNVVNELGIEIIEPPEIQRSQWLDISHWQGDVNFTAVKAKGVRGVIMKVCQAGDMIDDRFHEYYAGARAAGLLVGGYIFLKPATSATEHMANFLNAVGDRTFDIPVAIDYEDNDGQPVNVVTAVIQQLSNLLTQWQGRRPMIYTNLSYGNSLLPWSGWVEHPLWMAYWSDTAKYPLVPNGWMIDGKPAPGKPEIWQFDVNDNAAAFGITGSDRVDINLTFRSFEQLLGEPEPPPETVLLEILVNGHGTVTPGEGYYPIGSTITLTATPEDGWRFVSWGGDASGDQPVTSVLMDDDKIVSAFFAEIDGEPQPVEFMHHKGTQALTINLNIRSGPGTNYTIIGKVIPGATVEILETANDAYGNEWARIGYGQWSARVYNGVEYIRYIMA